MSALADKIRKAREFQREFDGWKLRLRRPSDAEAAHILRKDTFDALGVAREFVIGWEDVTEADVVPSGASTPAAFDADTWAEVLADQPALWEPIANAVVDAWAAYNKTREDRAKN